MIYRFEYRNNRREMVIDLEADELETVWSSDDWGWIVYDDLTVRFDIDRYIWLHGMVGHMAEVDADFGKVAMRAEVNSDTDLDDTLMGCYIEIYACRRFDMDVVWFLNHAQTDYGVSLIFPRVFYDNPAVWFEQEIKAHGISGEAEERSN